MFSHVLNPLSVLSKKCDILYRLPRLARSLIWVLFFHRVFIAWYLLYWLYWFCFMYTKLTPHESLTRSWIFTMLILFSARYRRNFHRQQSVSRLVGDLTSWSPNVRISTVIDSSWFHTEFFQPVMLDEWLYHETIKS